MRAFKQIVKEFWLQTLLSILWGLFKLKFAEPKENLISVFITNFSASLFLLSWMFGQIVRVKKQQKIDDEFNILKNELSKLLSKIELQTEKLIGYSLGGDSYAYFIPVIRNQNEISLELINNSKYPVYDITGKWLDMDQEPNLSGIGPLYNRIPFTLGNLFPGLMKSKALTFDMTDKESLRINIFMFSRNTRPVHQNFIIKRQGDNIKIARNLTSNDFTEVKIPPDFPGYDVDNPDEIFK
jgi:hypothetical protein